ncbi:PREDICTED: transposon, partial [Prunus dulcis]
LGITNGRDWVVISDKQKRLVPAIEIVLPTVGHKMCVRHLYNNFRASHIGLALKHILWAATRDTTLP